MNDGKISKFSHCGDLALAEKLRIEIFNEFSILEPTVVETTDKNDKIFKEELFGPVVTAYVYKDSQAKEIVNGIGQDTPYALTGALYSQDQ